MDFQNASIQGTNGETNLRALQFEAIRNYWAAGNRDYHEACNRSLFVPTTVGCHFLSARLSYWLSDPPHTRSDQQTSHSCQRISAVHTVKACENARTQNTKHKFATYLCSAFVTALFRRVGRSACPLLATCKHKVPSVMQPAHQTSNT